MSGRRIALVALGLLGLVALVVAGAVTYVLSNDWRPYVERYVYAHLHRRLTIDTLEIGWGDPLSLELGGVRLANADWGSKPEMGTVEHVSAVLDLRSIFGGPLRFEKLEITKLVIVLERDGSGWGNWRFSAPGNDSGDNNFNRQKRELFPTLLDFTLKDSLITYRTYKGNILRIDLNDVAIASTGDNAPVTLKADGAYNKNGLKLDATTQSFAAMRDADKPFGAKFTMATKADKSKAAKLDFDGTMMAPLDFDGVDGAMALDARNLGALLKVFGVELKADFPLALESRLTHDGDDWKLSKAKGILAKDPFIGAMHVVEGSHGKPDNFDFDLAFDRLNLSALIGKRSKQVGDPMSASLNPVEKGGDNLSARIKAATLEYGDRHLTDVNFDGGTADGRLNIRRFAFAYAGGRLELAGRSEPAEAGGHAAIDAALIDIDADKLAQSIGADPGQIKGRLDGKARLDMVGKTIADGLAGSNGYAVLAMASGSIERALVEKASADLRSLFREKEGSAKVECLLGVLTVKDGQGVLAPFRLHTSAGDFAAGGSIDLKTRHIDLTVKSDRSSTGAFALDIPIHISGPVNGPSVKPAVGADTDWLENTPGAAPLAGLPKAGQQLAASNSCAK
jgi:uncharacterized protein involved in outer membrane biogenesis